MRSSKGSHRIVVRDVEYRWRATGSDMTIGVSIWPTNGIGALIAGQFWYHETWKDVGNGCRSSEGDQIVITNRLVARIIEYALDGREYDPVIKNKQLNLGFLEDRIEWKDAVRARADSEPEKQS